MEKGELKTEDQEPIHNWFGLTYSSYLILQRTILQSMPKLWQKKFVDLLEELEDATFDLKDVPGNFWVRAYKNNKFTHDPYSNYKRGRRKIVLKNK